MADSAGTGEATVYGRRRSMTPVAWVVVAVGLIGFIVGVVWLGATPAPASKRTLLENPGAILVALIGAIAVLGSPIVAKLNAVQKEVQNSHKANLRDDLDGKHEDVLSKLDTVLDTLKDHGGAIVGIRTDLRQLRDVDAQQARDIADVRSDAARALNEARDLALRTKE